MNSAFFRQQRAAMQAQLRQSQSSSWLKRILVWLLLGVLMIFSLAALLFLVLLSWLLVPLMIYRGRRMMRRQQTADTHKTRHRQDNHTIEGEIISRDERG